MADIDYRCAIVERSWSLPLSWLTSHRKIDYGFWVRHTIDKPIAKTSSKGSGILRFEYDGPLDQHTIRVLRLEPEARCEPLRGSLITTPIAEVGEKLNYEALSYQWGIYDCAYSMDLEHQPFDLSTNLYTALMNLRSASEVRYLWIDAICINQGDVAERSSQIAMMRDIYAKASRVLVWLGPGTPESPVG